MTIEKNHNINVTLHSIKNLDEYQYKITPKLTKDTIKNIFLIDDVLKSGKTIIYGIKEISYPRRLQAVFAPIALPKFSLLIPKLANSK